MKQRRPAPRPKPWPETVPLVPATPIRDWVPELGVGRAHRPGLDQHPRPVPEAAVARWAQALRAVGIRSVISLLGTAELAEYDHLEGGLPGCYRRHGIDARFHPVRIDAEPTLTAEQLEAIRVDFDALPKPVVIHCNQGQVRSGTAVAYLRQAHALANASTPARSTPRPRRPR